MRDMLIVAIVVLGSIVALRRPWIGVMLWTWISIMNPHRYAWGFAVGAPVGTLAAASTLIGMLLTRERESPMKGPPVALFVVMMVWMTLSWLLGLGIEDDLPQWEKVMKIDLMILVALALLRTKEHIMALAWVATFSIALLGAKGGFFTLTTGGGDKVWGPAGSFIGDNNSFALAVVMSVPLVRFLQMQLASARARHAMTVVMVLMGASAMGSHSRGGLLAATAMAFMLWWRGRNKFVGGITIALAGVLLLLFMPAEWSERMSTIGSYEDDTSARGRFSAWWVAWRLAFDYPLGVGFSAARPELFAAYSPYPELGTPAAHSIYFQMLGNHGFVGLGLFMLVWWSTWRMAARIRKSARDIPEAQWCVDMANMSQVALVGYLAGGTFLSLAYFDLPYNVMVLVVLTQAWLRRRGWATDPVQTPGRWRIPGVHPPAPAGAR